MQISDTLMESVNELNDWGWVPNPLTAALQTEIAQRLLKTTYDYETLDQFTAEVNLRDALVG